MYQVIDGHTKKVMGNYKTRQTASRRVDRLDVAYGTCRYYYKKSCYGFDAKCNCTVCSEYLAERRA